MSEHILTCASCRHWRKQPKNPHALDAPTIGICKAMPPIPVLTGGNSRGMQITAMHPQTQENFEACGLFDLKVRVEG